MSELYTFELDQEVSRSHVTYKNRYGIALAADLYAPKALREGQRLPALVIGPPYAGTKEQGPGVYANQLARRGFICLAFDPAYMGESGGEPRHVSSPDIFAENFSAGVDYLGVQPFVDRSRIGAIGLCGSGGFALSAAQADTRIKAVATASLYDISAVGRMIPPDQLARTKEQLCEQRWRDFASGEPEYVPAFPLEPADRIPEGLDPVSAEFFSYYGMKRGHHPNARGNFTTTSQLAMLNFALLGYIREISPRPVLLIAGERAHSRAFSEAVFESAAEPKELYIVPDAIHIDLYDQTDKIPFDKLEAFFRENMA
ncbi:MAG: alpha/beta hydrolase [Clostridia bacterium]|nr:alpha/beta hydrolase [Clostridia bacterium]